MQSLNTEEIILIRYTICNTCVLSYILFSSNQFKELKHSSVGEMRQIALIFSVCLKFSSVLWLCAAVLCCDPELKELSSVQWVNSKELVFTWLSRCCYGREARQRRKKPLSLRLSHIPIFALARSLFLLLCSLVLSLPESLAG